MQTTLSLILTGMILACTLATADAAAKHKKAYLDSKQAGPDFAIQGEYTGTIGKATKLGAQVIALGDGKFRAVLYEKGLPGAGWNGATRVKLKGSTSSSKQVQFTGKNFRGKIVDGVFSGTAEEDVHFKMKKVERKSPTLGAKPAEGAIVLFDGSNVDAWKDGTLEDGKLLGVGARPTGTRTKRKFKDFTLHLEFRTPYMPAARGQGRGNSGMYLLDQYECQVLDSFGLSGRSNECGGIYKIAKPNVNMCLPPLSWQTYDVEFKAARFDSAGKKIANAVTTIRHNDVIIHEKLELPNITPGGSQSDEKPGALFLQNHGNPVHYRNIWIVEKN